MFGVAFSPRTLGWVLDDDAEVPGPDVWERLDGLLLDDGDGHLRFRRALMRDAAYEGLPSACGGACTPASSRRSSAHGRPRGRPGRHPGGALRAAGDHDRTWRYARIAGDRARQRAAPADAASHYRRALGAARGCGTSGTTMCRR